MRGAISDKVVESPVSHAIPEPPTIEATAEEIERDELLYHTWCTVCHGAGVTSGSSVPDLKHLLAARPTRAGDLIVRQGVSPQSACWGSTMYSASRTPMRSTPMWWGKAKAAIAFCQSEYPEPFATACTKGSGVSY